MMSFAAYLFIGVALLMVVLALAWIGPRLFSAPSIQAGLDRETTNLEVYRDELAQLALDYECGRISEPAREEARSELSRRLLDDADGAETTTNRMRIPTRAVGMAVMLLMPALATGLYLNVGSLNALSVATTDEAGIGEQDFYQQLLAHVKSNPRDARAWVALGRFEMESNRFRDAVSAFETAIDTSPKVANDATVLCELAEAVGMAQGGTFKGRPRELVEQALALAPNNSLALEMAGSAAYEARDYASAVLHWKALRAQMPEDAHAYNDISTAIARAEAEAMAAQPSLAGGAEPGAP